VGFKKPANFKNFPEVFSSKLCHVDALAGKVQEVFFFENYKRILEQTPLTLLTLAKFLSMILWPARNSQWMILSGEWHPKKHLEFYPETKITTVGG